MNLFGLSFILYYFKLSYGSNFWNNTQPRIKSVNHGSGSLSSLGPKIWELVPLEMREINSLLKFKEEIKKWEPKNCPCGLCKKFIQHVGYI